MINLQKSSTKSLRTMLRKFYAYHQDRLELAAKHAPGTPTHTRATRDAERAQTSINEIEAELRNRE